MTYGKSSTIRKTTLLYCLKCRKDTESKHPRMERTNKGKLVILSKCAVCDTKNSRFIKKQEASGLLSY